MRILAIRGSNLASLEGRFDVDLTGPVLGGAGVFAITGPTGSGKSTILDAMCLALFNRVPRVRDAARTSRTDPDGDGLTVVDPRNVLRRGAGEGEAEVDFLGVDGLRWRSTWSVRRARRRADGQLQQVTMSLSEPDGHVVAHGVEETRAGVERRLGLSWEQFTRSVLLAQGDFSAFLRASADERAALLERMTDTGLYGTVGRLAFERAKREGEELARRQAELDAVQTLGVEARAEVEAARAQAVAEGEAVRARAEGARLAQAWHRAAEERRGAVAAAAAEVEVAEQRFREAAAERAELEAVDAAQRGRAALERAEVATRAVVGARAELERAREREAEARRGEDSASSLEAEAAVEVARVEEAREAAEPELERAAAFDVRGRQAREEADAAERAARAAEEGAVLADASAAEGAAAEAGALAAAAEAAAWLDAHAGVAPVAAEWGRWRREIDRLRAAGELAAAATAALRVARDAQESLVAAEAERQQELERRQGALAKAQAALAGAAQAAGPDPAALRSAREDAAERLGACEALGRIARDAARESAALAEALRVATEARAGRAAAEEAARLGADDGGLAAAEAALVAARAASELAHRRAELREGEACPLCGAVEHPWAGDGPGDARVGELEQRVASLRSRASEAQRKAAAAAERAAALREREQDAESAAGSHRAALAAAQGAWSAAAASAARTSGGEGARLAWDGDDAATGGSSPGGTATSAGSQGDALVPGHGDTAGGGHAGAPWPVPPLPHAPDAVAADAAAAACRARLDAIAAQERRVEAQAAALEAARRAAEAAREAREGVITALREVERRRTLASIEVERNEGELARATAQAAAAWEELGPALIGCPVERALVRRDPQAGQAALAALVSAHAERTAGLARAREALAALGPRLAELRAASRRAREDLEERRATHRARVAALEVLREERRGILGGRPVEAVRQELGAAVAVARERHRQAAVSLDLARTASAAAVATAAASASELARRIEEGRAAEEALQGELSRLGLARAELAALLARDDRWREERRAHLRAIDDHRTTCTALLDERRRALAAHEASGAPSLSHEAAADVLTEAEATLSTLEERRVQSEVRLRADDEASRRRAELAPGMVQQEGESKLWSQLSSVIGDSAGKTFRNFAQSLSLDALLAAANVRLQELHRRYRLERVGGRELDIQIIDGDMGDDPRSVSSLSGGESFLVSLALALGLSSLSSRSVAIGSLFIDEGFGSLDPDTLHRAVGALEALQASGCQVGVISHVDGLAERLGARVVVRPLGAGRSEVQVLGASA
ncbi:MAG: hypothetical protein AMXMBFR64_26100 [Myxococcales bacterium]